MMRYPLKIYSWELISENIAIKQMDKSCFVNHGTGIPKGIKSYFDIPNSGLTINRQISLKLDENIYKAYLRQINNRFQLIWYSDFKNQIKTLFPEIYNAFKHNKINIKKPPRLIFEQLEPNAYSISFEDQIDAGLKSFLFTWNPTKWKWTDLPQAVTEANGEGEYFHQWACKSYKSIKEGDRAILIRLGVPPKGIIGAGLVISKPFKNLHYNSERAERGDQVYYVKIRFDLLDDKPIITEEELRSNGLGEHNNWFPESSGIAIPESFANLLENRLNEITGDRFIPPTQDEILQLRNEGTIRTRTVTTYERDPIARTQCLDHYGTSCQICNFSFQDFYGEIGTDYIEVHHIVPLSDIQGEHTVDPVNDLIPLCPNCHRMIHKRKPPYSIDEIREKIEQ